MMKNIAYMLNAAAMVLEMLIARLWAVVMPTTPQTISLQPRKILIFAYMGLGDAVMMLPMLRALKHAFPNAHVTALTTLPSPAHEILRLSGCIDQITLFPFKQASLRERWQMNSQLIKENFDLVLCSYIAPMPYFVRLVRNIPVRVGHHTPPRGWRHPRFAWLFTHPVAVSDNDRAHETTRYLALAEALGIDTTAFRTATNLAVQPTHTERARAYMRQQGIAADAVLLAVHPAVGATQPWRQWGVERLVETAQILLAEQEQRGKVARVLLLGSDADKPLLERMNAALQGKALIIIPDHVCQHEDPHDVPLSMTMAFLRECRVLIANDGGIAHLATACGAPLVRVFGMTDYHGYKALPNEQLPNQELPTVQHVDVWKALPCSPCMGLGVIKPGYNLTNCGQHECLRSISVQDVVQAARQAVEQSVMNTP
jgi:ADP-heptose:LPS heptosyltransferase